MLKKIVPIILLNDLNQQIHVRMEPHALIESTPSAVPARMESPGKPVRSLPTSAQQIPAETTHLVWTRERIIAVSVHWDSPDETARLTLTIANRRFAITEGHVWMVLPGTGAIAWTGSQDQTVKVTSMIVWVNRVEMEQLALIMSTLSIVCASMDSLESIVRISEIRVRLDLVLITENVRTMMGWVLFNRFDRLVTMLFSYVDLKQLIDEGQVIQEVSQYHYTEIVVPIYSQLVGSSRYCNIDFSTRSSVSNNTGRNTRTSCLNSGELKRAIYWHFW